MNPPQDQRVPTSLQLFANGAQPKDVFTPGEVAKICEVSLQMIVRCLEAGRLGGFHLPGSKLRRIPREALVKFMQDNGIPLDRLESARGTGRPVGGAGRPERKRLVQLPARIGPKTRAAEQVPVGSHTNTRARLLLVGKDPRIMSALAPFLELEGLQVDTAADELHAGRMMLTTRYHLVFTEVTNGLNQLWAIRRQHPYVVVLVIAGYGTTKRAEEAVKAGAFGYLIWPIIDDEIREMILKALQYQKLLSENYQLRQQLKRLRPE